MTTNDYGRLALSAVIGGLAAVAITKAGTITQSAMLRWIAYCLLAGLLINTQSGMKFKYLISASLLSSLSLTAALLWIALLNNGVILNFSGTDLDFNKDRYYASQILLGLFIISTAGVTIGSTARPATIDLIHKLTQIDIEKAKKIESLLKIVVSITAAIGLLIL